MTTSDTKLDLKHLAPYDKWALIPVPDSNPLGNETDHWDRIENLPLNLTDMVKVPSPFKDLSYGRVSSAVPGELTFNGTVHQVCVKRYHQEYVNMFKPAFISTIAREIKLLQSLRHPNILHFHGICVRYNKEYPKCMPAISIITPWCDGRNVLSFLLKAPNTARLPLFLDITKGLSYLHRRDIVHGLVTPSSVLIKSTNKGLRAVICGFGHARILNDEVPLECFRRYGKYLPGEIAWPLHPTFSTKESDIYGLGLTALAVISGKEAFPELDTDTACEMLSDGERPSRQTHDHPEMKDAVWQLLSACWDTVPENRPDIDYVVAQVTSLVQRSQRLI